MATIAEIRKEYPQYSDMTDTQLADAFHSKFYSDIPKDTFYTQLGIKTTPVSSMELMFGAGSPIARTIKGAVVDPALAVNQLLASTGLFGGEIKKGATQLVSDVEQATTEGRARVGSSGFDPYQLLGNVISPVNRLVGVTQAPLSGQGLAANIARSGSTGAALSALQPVNAPVEQFGERKLEQMATGFVLGPIVEGGVKAVGGVLNTLKGLTPTGRQEFMQKQLKTCWG